MTKTSKKYINKTKIKKKQVRNKTSIKKKLRKKNKKGGGHGRPHIPAEMGHLIMPNRRDIQQLYPNQYESQINIKIYYAPTQLVELMNINMELRDLPSKSIDVSLNAKAYKHIADNLNLPISYLYPEHNSQPHHTEISSIGIFLLEINNIEDNNNRWRIFKIPRGYDLEGEWAWTTFEYILLLSLRERRLLGQNDTNNIQLLVQYYKPEIALEDDRPDAVASYERDCERTRNE